MSGRGVLVGVDFADNLQLQVGDTLSIYSIREIKKMKEAREHKREVTILPDDYEVRGIFDTGYYEYNARVIVTSLANAQDLYDLEDSVHGLFVMLDDPYQADDGEDAVGAGLELPAERRHLLRAIVDG